MERCLVRQSNGSSLGSVGPPEVLHSESPSASLSLPTLLGLSMHVFLLLFSFMVAISVKFVLLHVILI
uniref:Uncharacterized protein n=1 Tax=Anguilla anguilla TaxID=7936 RepID=A0A0E9VC35_ANGAN